MLRGNANVIGNSVRFNVEADSLNLSLLGPDAAAGGAEFDLFVREVAREMTVKAGQKCTAIRRAMVPAGAIDAVTEALADRLNKTVVGNPRNETVRMGPIVDKTQQPTSSKASGCCRPRPGRSPARVPSRRSTPTRTRARSCRPRCFGATLPRKPTRSTPSRCSARSRP